MPTALLPTPPQRPSASTARASAPGLRGALEAGDHDVDRGVRA